MVYSVFKREMMDYWLVMERGNNPPTHHHEGISLRQIHKANEADLDQDILS